jgi:DNA-binding transcriptional LysR family regulator
VSEIARLEEITRDVASGGTASLRIGSADPALRVLIPRILRAIRAEIPDVRISLHPANTHTQLRELVDGQLEAGILRSRNVPFGTGVYPAFAGRLGHDSPAGCP